MNKKSTLLIASSLAAASALAVVLFPNVNRKTIVAATTTTTVTVEFTAADFSAALANSRVVSGVTYHDMTKNGVIFSATDYTVASSVVHGGDFSFQNLVSSNTNVAGHSSKGNGFTSVRAINGALLTDSEGYVSCGTDNAFEHFSDLTIGTLGETTLASIDSGAAAPATERQFVILSTYYGGSTLGSPSITFSSIQVSWECVSL